LSYHTLEAVVNLGGETHATWHWRRAGDPCCNAVGLRLTLATMQ